MEASVTKLLKENEELVKELISLKHLCRNLKNKYKPRKEKQKKKKQKKPKKKKKLI
jgi:hypothetical protein